MRLSKIEVVAMILLLLGLIFSVIPVKSQNPTIKIGVIGPQGLPHWSPAGMQEGAELARDEINAAGGVNVGGVMHNIELVYGNEYAVPVPDPASAAAEVERLITVEGAQFIIGGFRTEVTGAMIEKAMDYGVPFFICGASTDDLISTRVPVNYGRYKYLFRVTPVNSTVLFKTIAAFLGGYAIPNVLLPIYGDYLWPGAPVKQVRVAVLTEDLNWTKTMHMYFTDPAIYPGVLGPHANVTYSARVPATATDLSSYLSPVIASRARLMIHIFSGLAGLYLIVQWASMGVQALPVGINVMAQLDTHWTSTGGLCEYEAVLNFAGTRTPIVPGYTEVFWDNFLAYTLAKHGAERWPIYTAWGAYDALYLLKESIEAAGTVDPDALVPVLEATDRTSLAGRFRFTASHDVYATLAELGPYVTGNVRAMMIQWQHARMEVVWPIDALYSRMVRLPPAMYPLITDLNYDGLVDLDDVIMAALAFGSYPGHPRWRMEAELTGDSLIDIDDIILIALDFGEYVTLPLP